MSTLAAEVNGSLKTSDPDEFESYLHEQEPDAFDEHEGLHHEPDPEPDFAFDADPEVIASMSASSVRHSDAFEPTGMADFDEPHDESDDEPAFDQAIASPAVNVAPDPDVDKFAKYTGYTPGTEEVEAANSGETSTDVTDDATSTQLQTQADGDDVDDEDEVVDPRAAKTKVGLVGSPLTRIALIGGGTLLAVGALGAFLSGVTGDKTQQVVVPKSSPPSEVQTDPTDPNQAPSKKEGQYRTETALAGQRQSLGEQTSPSSTPSSTPKSTVATPLPSPTPVAIASIPFASVPTPLPVTASLLATPIDRGQTKTDDPVEKWRTIAAMGSYGQVPMLASSSNPAYATPVPVPATPILLPTPVPTTAATASGTPSIRQLRSGASAVPGLRDRPVAMVLTGSSATGQLTTGVVLSGDNTTAINPDSPTATKYLVTLKAALKDANGEEALPSGASLVMTAKSFSPQSGLAEFQAVAVIVSNKEYALPTGAIVVRGENGAPLTLAKRGGSGGLFKSILPAFFAGVSQAGQILNQPTSSSSVSGGNVSATTSSSNPSPLAGFAQGFGQNISQMLTQQTNAANQNQANQPNAWALNAGTAVMVFVNSSFEM